MGKDDDVLSPRFPQGCSPITKPVHCLSGRIAVEMPLRIKCQSLIFSSLEPSACVLSFPWSSPWAPGHRVTHWVLWPTWKLKLAWATVLDRPGGNFGDFCTINVGDICTTLRGVHVHSGERIYVGFYRNLPSNETWKASSFRGALTTASSHLCVLPASFMLPFFLLLQV